MFEEDSQLGPKDARRSSGRKQKSVTRTFRIKTEWDDILKREADKKGISVNVLVNSILQKYALFDRWTHGYNSISINQQTFQTILSNIPEEKLASIGEKTGTSDVQNILDSIGLPSTYDSFAYLVSNHFGSAERAMWFSCCRHFHDNSDIFHLQHNLGRGWSIFLQEYFLSHLRKLKMRCESRVYDYAVNLKVPRP